MAARVRQIREALVSRLASLTVANGYSANVATVKGTLVNPLGGVDLPLICVVEEATDKTEDTLKRVRCETLFAIDVWTKGEGDTRHDAVADLAADVENILTSPDRTPAMTGAAWYDLGFVRNAIPVGDQPIEAEDVVTRGIVSRRVLILVEWTHNRGEA